MPDYVDRDFEWDIDKSEATYQRRGFDFQFASRLFEDPNYRERLEHRDYGEERVVKSGLVDGIHITVIWTERGSRRRIISAFLSARKDIIDYEQAIGWGSPWPN
jgi:uncharacterized DUF497 family protein